MTGCAHAAVPQPSPQTPPDPKLRFFGIPGKYSKIIGKIPKINDHIPEPKLGINFKILEADHRKIHKVLVSRGETLGEKQN